MGGGGHCLGPAALAAAMQRPARPPHRGDVGRQVCSSSSQLTPPHPGAGSTTAGYFCLDKYDIQGGPAAEKNSNVPLTSTAGCATSCSQTAGCEVRPGGA